MGRFLLLILPKLSTRASKFVIYFVLAFIDGINTLKESKEYCKENPAYNLPMSFNELPTNAAPEFASKEELLKNNVLVCKMLYYFGKWLYHEKYTNLDLKFNTI